MPKARPSMSRRGGVARDVPAVDDEGLPDPGLTLVVDLPINLVRHLGADGPLVRTIHHGRRHPDVVEKNRRGPHFPAVEPLFLEQQPAETVDEPFVVVEQDGGVEDADHPAVLDDGRGDFQDQSPVLDLGVSPAGQGCPDDLDDGSVGQILAFVADVLIAENPRSGCRLPVAEHPLDIAVMGDAVAPGVEIIGPDQNGAVGLDDVDDVEGELGFDLGQLGEQEFSIFLLRRPEDFGGFGQIFDDPGPFDDFLVVELRCRRQGIADGFGRLPDEILVDDVDPDDERERPHDHDDREQADDQLEPDIGRKETRGHGRSVSRGASGP
jgi:hypothetical protein